MIIRFDGEENQKLAFFVLWISLAFPIKVLTGNPTTINHSLKKRSFVKHRWSWFRNVQTRCFSMLFSVHNYFEKSGSRLKNENVIFHWNLHCFGVLAYYLWSREIYFSVISLFTTKKSFVSRHAIRAQWSRCKGTTRVGQIESTFTGVESDLSNMVLSEHWIF